MEKLTRTSYRELNGNPREGYALLSENLVDQESFYRPLERLHGGTLHDPGVAEGLTVSARLGSPDLTVSPGVALDVTGRHIALAVDGRAIIAAATVVTVPSAGLLVPTGTTTADLVLTIEWAETFDRDAFEHSKGATFQFDHSPKVLLRPPIEVGREQVVLANVSLTNGAVTRLEVGERTGAGITVDNVLLRHPAVRDATGRKVVDQAPVAQIGTAADALFVRVPAGAQSQPALKLSANLVQALTTDGREALAVDRTTGEVRALKLTVPASGRLGLGVASPQAALHVKGGAIMPEVGNSPTAGIQFPSDPAGGTGDQAYLRYHTVAGEATRLVLGIDNDPDDALVLRQQGADRLTIVQGKVGIGTSAPQTALQVKGGPITPEIGNSEAGIMWPANPAGGAGDRAYIRYSITAVEATRLEIGNDNDADDVVVLRQSATDLVTLRNRNVGIGTSTPALLLDVNGPIAVLGKEAVSGDSGWLYLNRLGGFPNGTWTPGDSTVRGQLIADGVGTGEGGGVSAVVTGEQNGTGVWGECNVGTNAAGVYGVSTTGYGGWFKGNVLIQGNIQVTGNQKVNGTKAAVVRSKDGEDRVLYAVESPECWFEDFGFGQLENGRAEVTLDERFVAVIRHEPYHVFLSEYDDSSGLHVTGRTAYGFTVVGAEGSGSEFSYRIVAKRHDVDVARFEDEVPPLPEPKVRPDKDVPPADGDTAAE